ncbi:hypothetical protein GmHk_06G016641 [Glycine max]|nr:hypothetical protein GmHk_06G016641 [Glycine max]
MDEDQTNLDPHRVANPTIQTLPDAQSYAAAKKTQAAQCDRETTPYRTPDDSAAATGHGLHLLPPAPD